MSPEEKNWLSCRLVQVVAGFLGGGGGGGWVGGETERERRGCEIVCVCGEGGGDALVWMQGRRDRVRYVMHY